MATSDKYQYISTNLLINSVREPLGSVLDFDKARYGTGGGGSKHHYTVPVKTDGSVLLDGVVPTVNIINSYHGECALKILVGFYRMVCSNGMIIGEGTYNRKVHHVKGQKVNYFLTHFEQELTAAVEDVSQLLTYVRSTVDMAVSSERALSMALDLQQRGVLTKSAYKNVHTIYSEDATRRTADKYVMHSIYGLWNICNEELRRTRSSRTSDGKLVERNSKLLDSILDVYQDVA